MSLKKAPPLLSRLLLVVSSILAVGALFLFFSQALEPVDVPLLSFPKVARPFNPKADVSENPSFQRMHLPNMTVPEFQQGKDNPFLPASTSTRTERTEIPTTTTEGVPELEMDSPSTTILLPAETPVDLMASSSSVPSFESSTSVFSEVL